MPRVVLCPTHDAGHARLCNRPLDIALGHQSVALAGILQVGSPLNPPTSVSSMFDAPEDPLEIDVQVADDRTLVTLSGELDAATATLLYDQLSDLEVEDVQHVVLDLAQVSFMDSTGLSVIVTEHKRLQHVGGG